MLFLFATAVFNFLINAAIYAGPLVMCLISYSHDNIGAAYFWILLQLSIWLYLTTKDDHPPLA